MTRMMNTGVTSISYRESKHSIPAFEIPFCHAILIFIFLRSPVEDVDFQLFVRDLDVALNCNMIIPNIRGR